VLGFAFKADTNDTREAPAIRICRDLLEEGAQLAIYDPKVPAEQMAHDLGQSGHMSACDVSSRLHGEGVWTRCSTVLQAAEGADAVLILTEWDEFRVLSWHEVQRVMRQPAWLFDARSIADSPSARAAGLNVWTVGEG
jgi:UDPglucose 6-dehydrogenase